MSGTTKNPGQEKPTDALADALTERATKPVQRAPGYYHTEIIDPKGNLVFKETISVPCCGHGGEPIPQGGFRGGAEDIQTIPGKFSETKQPSSRSDGFASAKEAMEFAVKVQKDAHNEGFEQGKNYAANTKGSEAQEEEEEEEESGLKTWLKKNWLVAVAVIIIVTIAIWSGKVFGVFVSEDTDSHREVEQLEPVVAEDVVVSPFTSQDAGDLNQEPQDSPVDVTVLDEQKVSPERVSDEELKKALAHLKRYSNNLGMLPDKLGKHDKLIVLASIVTLPTGLSQQEERERLSVVSRKLGETLVVSPTEVTQRAYNYGRIAEHYALNKSPNSIHWWANLYASASGISLPEETEFSRQVMENISRLEAMRKLLAKNA